MIDPPGRAGHLPPPHHTIMNNTTRRYPRSTLEAWPERHPYAIEKVDTRVEAFGSVLLACAIGIGLALALVAWWAA